LLKNLLKKQRTNNAISNTSPLIALKHISVLEKLNLIFQRIIIPPTVMKELSIKEKEYFGGLSLLYIEEPHDKRLVTVLKAIVDEGEAEAIALALEKGSLLIIDDLKGRRIAKRLGIRIIGTLGLLKLMKLKGIISEVKPFIKILINKGFYVDRELIEQLLKDVGEA